MIGVYTWLQLVEPKITGRPVTVFNRPLFLNADGLTVMSNSEPNH